MPWTHRAGAFAAVSVSAGSLTITVAQRDETRGPIRQLGSATGHYAGCGLLFVVAFGPVVVT